MSSNFKHISIVVASLILIGCGGGNSVPNGVDPTPQPVDTTKPTFISANTASAVENQTTVMTVVAVDDSAVTYSILGGEDAAKFAIDSTSGALTFVNAPDFESPEDAGGDNGYKVEVTATDSATNSEMQAIMVTVTNDINDQPIDMTSDYAVKSLGKATSIEAKVDLGSIAKTLYVLFSNYDKTTAATPIITHNQKAVAVHQQKNTILSTNISQPKVLHSPAYIQEFNSNIRTLLQSNTTTSEHQSKDFAITTERQADVAGDSQTFYLDTGTTNTTAATAKKVVSDGTKTLNIWVSNDSFGTGCSKAKCVTQAMVDALADTFLKTGDDNDIYDWVTNIYGEEWSSDAQAKYTNLIAENNEITILLTDIDNDNSPTGGVIGYFWAKDNFDPSSISGSNERVMFYADAVMFANEDNGDFWQKEMYSTLAHEFQHMIHFYQKRVILDAADDTWINEMLSETTEDLIATKIQHTGPRGIDPADGSAGASGNTDGRYPLFNANNTLSLTTWNNSLADYSKVNAFGTFLTRNYGGAKILHDIVYNSFEHEDAIIDAVHKTPQGAGKTFDDLLKEWGVAVLLSNNENLQNTPEYNTGDFTLNTYNNSTYELGSINFFNYDPQPTIAIIAGEVKPQGNYYYKVGDGLTGIVDINLTLNGTTEATLIAK